MFPTSRIIFPFFFFFQVRLEGYEWSAPFSIGTEGVMSVYLRSNTGMDQIHLKIEVRSGTKSCRYEVIFRPSSFSSPYRFVIVSSFCTFMLSCD